MSKLLPRTERPSLAGLAEQWPGRPLAILFLACIALVIARSQDILARYVALQATWPPPPFAGSEWGHPEPLSFAFVAMRVSWLAVNASLPGLVALVLLGRRHGLPGSTVLTAMLTGFVVLEVLGTPLPQFVRAVIGMAGPDGRSDNPATFVVAPVVEELLKLLAIVLVVVVARLRVGIRGGVVIGAAVGLGITVGETASYSLVELVQRDDYDVLFIVAMRFALLGAGLHASTAALTGAGLGLWMKLARRSSQGALALVASLALAMLTHGAWNRLSEDLGNSLMVPFGAAGGLPVVAFFVGSVAALPFLAAAWVVLAVAWRRGRPPGSAASPNLSAPVERTTPDGVTLPVS